MRQPVPLRQRLANNPMLRRGPPRQRPVNKIARRQGRLIRVRRHVRLSQARQPTHSSPALLLNMLRSIRTATNRLHDPGAGGPVVVTDLRARPE
jgi:hypothetical protein